MTILRSNSVVAFIVVKNARLDHCNFAGITKLRAEGATRIILKKKKEKKRQIVDSARKSSKGRRRLTRSFALFLQNNGERTR